MHVTDVPGTFSSRVNKSFSKRQVAAARNGLGSVLLCYMLWKLVVNWPLWASTTRQAFVCIVRPVRQRLWATMLPVLCLARASNAGVQVEVLRDKRTNAPVKCCASTSLKSQKNMPKLSTPSSASTKRTKLCRTHHYSAVNVVLRYSLVHFPVVIARPFCHSIQLPARKSHAQTSLSAHTAGGSAVGLVSLKYTQLNR